MTKTTITEALSEINLINKKLQAKKAVVLANLCSITHAPDPFERDGGSPKYVGQEIQSVVDLYERLTKIRAAIATANLHTMVTVGEQTRSITEWLVWKKEVAKNISEFYGQIAGNVKMALSKYETQPQVYENSEGKKVLVQVRANVDMGEFLKRRETTDAILEGLDGQLSLKNATITIEY